MPWSGNNYIGDASNDIATGTDVGNGMYGYEGDDNLIGAGGDDWIDGGVGNDDLQGGDGNDRLTDVGSIPSGFSGIIGHDTLRGGNGDDQLTFNSPDSGDQATGGSGTDTLYVTFEPYGSYTDQPVTCFLGNGEGTIYLNQAYTVGFSGIEKIGITGSRGNDFLTGGAMADTLDGNGGNDVLRGLGGDDFLYDDGGILDIDGGDGFDRVSFSLATLTTAIEIDTGRGGRIDLGLHGTIKNCEQVGSATTGSGNDTITLKQDGYASIDTGLGDDRVTLIGLGGDDIVTRGGNDTIRSGAGADEVDPGAGADLVYLGEGDDYLIYYYVTGNRTDTGADTIYGEGGNDYVTTAAGADLVDGGDGNDEIYSGREADRVFGGLGADELNGEGGGDRLDGQDGDDVISADYDSYFDEITEDDDLLIGGEGNDNLYAGVGLDTLDGGAGDDTLGVSYFKVNYDDYNSWELELSKVDVVRGGAGTDVLSVSLPSGINVPWQNDPTTYRIVLGATRTSVSADGAVVTRATDVERLFFNGNQAGDHYIVGGELADRGNTGTGDSYVNLKGGDDTITSQRGSDTLLAGTGNDRGAITLGGRDRVDMGEGDDRLTIDNWYTTADDIQVTDGVYNGGAGTDALTINFNYGTGWTFDGQKIRIGEDIAFRLIGFESFSYTGALYNGAYNGGSGGDTVSLTQAGTVNGGGGNDTIFGSYSGADSIDGGNGNDLIYGYGGNDTLAGGAGLDRFVFNTPLNATSNVDVIDDFAVDRDTIELNNYYFYGLFDGVVYDYQFHVGTEATDYYHRIIYDDATGNLFYDSNGNYAGGQVLFAVLDPGLALAAADFWVA